jgi:hypothetical protein
MSRDYIEQKGKGGEDNNNWEIKTSGNKESS